MSVCIVKKSYICNDGIENSTKLSRFSSPQLLLKMYWWDYSYQSIEVRKGSFKVVCSSFQLIFPLVFSQLTSCPWRSVTYYQCGFHTSFTFRYLSIFF